MAMRAQRALWRALAVAALCVLAGPAAASDLAGDADAARVEELVREDDWHGAREIWLRRGADADRDVGCRWRDLERYFRSDASGWKLNAHRARCVAMLSAFLDRDALGVEACRIAREKAAANERAEMAWWTALTLTRLGRPADAAPFFADGAPAHAFNEKAKEESADLARVSSRIASGEFGIDGRIALSNTLCGFAGDADGDTFAARAASGMLRRTLDALPAKERTVRLCAAAFSAALFARDASDLAAALAAWTASGADVSRGVAAALDGWRCGDRDPFAGQVARIAADAPTRPQAAWDLSWAAERFDPAAAERLLRMAAAHPDASKTDFWASTPEARDAVAAIHARRCLALLCERRRQFAAAIDFWKGVRPHGECGCESVRPLGIDGCRIALGRAAEVLADDDRQHLDYDWISEWIWIRVRAASSAGHLDEWLAANSGEYPFDSAPERLADALRLERMRQAADIDGLVAELVSGIPLDETLLTPRLRLVGLAQLDRRAAWRRDEALELLRDLDGKEVGVLVRRLAELPVSSAPAPKRSDAPDGPRPSLHAWIVAALANSRSPEAARALTELRTQAVDGKDIGVSAAALDEALRLHARDLPWIR